MHAGLGVVVHAVLGLLSDDWSCPLMVFPDLSTTLTLHPLSWLSSASAACSCLARAEQGVAGTNRVPENPHLLYQVLACIFLSWALFVLLCMSEGPGKS